ncbi:bifunctional 2-polyprenyl-6-hydroxyphenol methylase/3-demethylubiquinol 3-O-methyltransferase UbiG [Streptomyces sp. MBT84]|uniref:class I SAM-dependent methyltransferase n=1 Tax=Streptomyces sp. MBT84 TaxID=1488414 RepID=UPI001C6E8D20|nr:methyltransferase domain-containing protein [Streptomyces sp. MBT84]
MTESRQECIHPYGDTRHRAQDAPAAGGPTTGFDRSGGELLHALRLGQLLAIIGAPAGPRTPLSVLDAGCGRGWFARALARGGHRVDAFDVSSAAVAQARGEGGGPRYAVADLSGWRSPRPYDVVLCLDVLFHVLDERGPGVRRTGSAAWDRSAPTEMYSRPALRTRYVTPASVVMRCRAPSRAPVMGSGCRCACRAPVAWTRPGRPPAPAIRVDADPCCLVVTGAI